MGIVYGWGFAPIWLYFTRLSPATGVDMSLTRFFYEKGEEEEEEIGCCRCHCCCEKMMLTMLTFLCLRYCIN